MSRASAAPGGYRRVVAQALGAHSLLGIVLGALIYQVCLTGALSVFAPEFKRWEQPHAPLVEDVAPEGLAAALANGLAMSDTPVVTIAVFGPTPELPRMEIRLPGKTARWASADGVPAGPAATPWSLFITELHEELSLSSPYGSVIVGISGVALLAAIGTGLLAHRRIFRDAFRLRLGGTARLEAADLHNRISVWALPFHLTVAFTGAFLGLVAFLGTPLALVAYGGDAGRAMAELRGEGSTDDRTPAPLPDVAGLIRKVEAVAAPARVTFVLAEAAGTAGRLLHIDTEAPRDLASGESYRFRGQGEPLGRFGYTDGPVERQIRAALYVLHVGSFGAWPLRILYGLLGLALCWITATGMTIWFARLRSQGRAVPALERLWAAVLWGQPPALTLSAIVTLGGWWTPAPFYLAATTAMLAMGATSLPPSTLARLFRALTAGLLLLLVVQHALAFGFSGDAMALAVNGVVGITACLLAAALLVPAVQQPSKQQV